jgi:V/A-type H+-transporting ATPase subunit E
LARVEETIEERRAGLDAEHARFVRAQEAVLPLEKIRFLASFENKSIVKAMDAYLQGLSGEKKETIVAEQLAAFRSFLEGQKVTVECFGMDDKNAAKLVEKTSGAKVTRCTVIDDKMIALLLPPAREGITTRAGVVVETADKGLRCRATLDEKIESIMDTYNYELAETLFGGRLPA